MEPRGGKRSPVRLGTRIDGSRVPCGSDQCGWLGMAGSFSGQWLGVLE